MKLGSVFVRCGDLVILTEAVLWLAMAELALRLLPFRKLARLMAPNVAWKTCTAERRETCLLKVRWAVVAASRRVPWRSVCFHQGIAAQRMLSRRGITAQLNYGVGRNDNGLAAHVWTTAGDVIVVGGETADDFVKIATFPPR